MNVKIIKPPQGGIIHAVASKSEAHRLLICAALADKETFIVCPNCSEDIDATINCLKALGALICYEQDGFRVMPVNRQTEKNYRLIDCGESGSTLRFLLPVCGALGLHIDFYMRGQLPKRPILGLYEEIVSHGCKLSESGCASLTCEGQLKNGLYFLPGNVSSQFISGLLLALPLISGESIIKINGILESRFYIDMTLDALKLFKIKVYKEGGRVYKIPGGQVGCSPKNIHVGGDWSNAAFWLTLGAIGKNSVICTGLNLNSKQGDKAIVKLLSRFGACVVCENDKIAVSPNTLHGINIDAKNIPDLVPVLAAVASVAKGRTIIKNAGRLRLKESNRLKTITALLSCLGADITETADGLIINGKNKLTGGKTESFGDHRIAMTAAILSAVCTDSVIIKNAEAVKKSYPGFFDDFCAVFGGICETEE